MKKEVFPGGGSIHILSLWNPADKEKRERERDFVFFPFILLYTMPSSEH